MDTGSRGGIGRFWAKEASVTQGPGQGGVQEGLQGVAGSAWRGLQAGVRSGASPFQVQGHLGLT